MTVEPTADEKPPIVGVVMGSQSDWKTMAPASEILNDLGIPHECRVVSAHRTPKWLVEYGESAAARGLHLIIAGAGGAAHLPGMLASMTLLPVLGVPVQTSTLQGLDSLLSIVQMPGGVPVGTMAIGTAGAKNAALLAARMLALHNDDLRQRLQSRTDATTADVLQNSHLPPSDPESSQ